MATPALLTGCEAAELMDGPLDDLLHVLKAPDIRRYGDSFGAFGFTVMGEILQGGFVSGHKNELGPKISQGTSGRKANATQCRAEPPPALQRA